MNNDIAKNGLNTRFGQPNGPCPKQARASASPPYSIRKAIRRIMCLSVKNPRALFAGFVECRLEIENTLSGHNKRPLGLFERHAATIVAKSLQGNVWALDRVLKAVG